MDQDLLFRIGEALYGRDWESALARDLAMSRRAISRMASGQNPIADGFARDVVTIIKHRVEGVAALHARAPDVVKDKLMDRARELGALSEEAAASIERRLAG